MGDAAWGSWEDHSRTPKYGKPPQHPGALQSAVPLWERRFCTFVCLIPWGRICAAKASLSAYKSISDWDDAAAFEAFQNAKARYWADINGLPCDIPLPDPDMFIEMVNHKVVIDPKLVEDLEKHPPPRLPDGEKDGSSGRDSFIFESKPIPAAGWGNAGDGSTEDHHSVNWDKFIEQPHRSPGWRDSENHISRNGDSSDAWNCRGGWGDVTVQDCSGGGDGTNYSWNKGRDPSWGQHWNNEQGRGNNRKRSRGHYDSRFSKSKQMNNHQAERSKWNDRAERNKADYSYEKTMRGGQLMFMQQSEPRWSYWPANHQRSGESGGARYWEKSSAVSTEVSELPTALRKGDKGKPL